MGRMTSYTTGIVIVRAKAFPPRMAGSWLLSGITTFTHWKPKHVLMPSHCALHCICYPSDVVDFCAEKRGKKMQLDGCLQKSFHTHICTLQRRYFSGLTAFKLSPGCETWIAALARLGPMAAGLPCMTIDRTLSIAISISRSTTTTNPHPPPRLSLLCKNLWGESAAFDAWILCLQLSFQPGPVLCIQLSSERHEY